MHDYNRKFFRKLKDMELEETKHALHEHKKLEDEKRRYEAVMKRRMGLEAMLKTLDSIIPVYANNDNIYLCFHQSRFLIRKNLLNQKHMVYCAITTQMLHEKL